MDLGGRLRYCPAIPNNPQEDTNPRHARPIRAIPATERREEWRPATRGNVDMSKIILAALAAVTIAILTVPAAEASSRQAHQPPGWIDVGAIPAYPTSQSNRRPRSASAASSRRADAVQERRKAAEARTASPGPRQAESAGNGQVTRGGMVRVTTAYGFPITVHPAYAAKFQRFFLLLKESGHKMPDRLVRVFNAGLGCFARGGHVSGSNHYIGAACDIQWGWNQAPSFMYHVGNLIRQAGLYDGCSFRDCGHVEAVRGTHNRAPNLYASIEKFKAAQATANYQP